MRSGRPELCTFETGNGKPFVLSSQSAQEQAQRNHEEIDDLRAEVFQLKELLSQNQIQNERHIIPDAIYATDYSQRRTAAVSYQALEGDTNTGVINKDDPTDPRDRPLRGYYHQHTLFKFFVEVSE